MSGPLIGKYSGFINYADLFVPLCIVAWYMTHTLGMQQFLLLKPVKLSWYTFVALYKTHSVIDMVNTANHELHATAYYPTPFLGPIIVGTLVGCFGNFLPFDKGLYPIKEGTPWGIQSVFMVAFFYHAMINDENGFIGMTMRAVFGSLSDTTVRIILAIMMVSSAYAQTLFSYDANFFTPFHKFLYLFLQVQGPTSVANSKKADHDTVGWDYNTRIFLERVLDFGRVLAVLAVLGGYVFMSYPPSVITTGQFLPVGGSIGGCQLLSSMQGCTPHVMLVENSSDNTIQLSTYKGKGKFFTPSPGETAKWFLSMKSSDKIPTDGETGVVLSEDGVLRLISRSKDSNVDKLLWSSKSTCPVTQSTAPAVTFLSLDASGQGVVNCSDGSVVPVI